MPSFAMRNNGRARLEWLYPMLPTLRNDRARFCVWNGVAWMVRDTSVPTVQCSTLVGPGDLQVSACEWGGMLEGTLVYPPGKWSFYAFCPD